MVSRWFQDSGKVAGFRGDVPRGFFFAPAAPFAVIPLAGVVQSRPFNRTGSSLISIGARGSSMASRLDRVAHNTRIGSALAFFFCFYFGLLFFLGGGIFWRHALGTKMASWRHVIEYDRTIETRRRHDNNSNNNNNNNNNSSSSVATPAHEIRRFVTWEGGRGRKQTTPQRQGHCVCVCVCVCVCG